MQTPQTTETNTSAKIVIDPGHGGDTAVGGSNANNATGPAGTLEKDMTLNIALMVGGLVSNLGHAVRFTRVGDVNVGLADRAAVARSFGADVFVSIHLNGFGDASVQGSETLIAPDASTRSRSLAVAIQRHVVAALGHRDRGVKPQSLGVLRPERHAPHTAACLVEPCFLTNPDEEKRLEDETYQLSIATAVTEGIAAFWVTNKTSARPQPNP